jgi:hypothetical protein
MLLGQSLKQLVNVSWRGNMSKKKTYTHNPVRVVKLEHLRAAQLRDGKPYIEIDENGNENEIKDHDPRHQMEFKGSNNFYLWDAAKYVCTHHREALHVGKIYIEAEFTYDKFLDVTIGEFKKQHQRLMDELSNTGKKKCYIPNGKGGVFIMTPFNVVYETVENDKLTNSEFKSLKNINAKKINKIHLFFPTPIFEEYLNGTNKQFYRHPVNLYARIYDILTKMDIKNMHGLVAGKDYYRDINYEELLPSPMFVEGYIRFFDYLYKHGAGDPRKSSISIDEADCMKTCTPSLIHVDGNGKVRIRDHKKYEAFFKMAVILSNVVKGFDFKLIGAPTPDYSDFGKRRRMIFKIEHPKKWFNVK